MILLIIPSQGQIQILIETDKEEPTTVEIWNSSGQLVQQVYEGHLSIGTNTFAIAENGNLESGIYFVKTQSDSFSVIKKLVVIK